MKKPSEVRVRFPGLCRRSWVDPCALCNFPAADPYTMMLLLLNTWVFKSPSMGGEHVEANNQLLKSNNSQQDKQQHNPSTARARGRHSQRAKSQRALTATACVCMWPTFLQSSRQVASNFFSMDRYGAPLHLHLPPRGSGKAHRAPGIIHPGLTAWQQGEGAADGPETPLFSENIHLLQVEVNCLFRKPHIVR